MREVRAEWVADVTGMRAGHDLRPVAQGLRQRYLLRDGTVTALDERLTPVRTARADLPETVELLAATPDLTVVVAAGPAEAVVLAHGRRLTLGIEAADSATLLPGGRLLLTAPEIEHLEHRGRPYVSKGAHLVHLADLRTGRILDRAELEVVDAGVLAEPHPHDGSVLLDAGMGQDGSRLFAVWVRDDRLTVEDVAEDVVTGGFSPDGTRALMLPHPSFDDVVTVVSWPGLDPVARVEADELGVDDLMFELHGCFLADDRILLSTDQHGLLLTDGELGRVTRVRLPLPPGGEEDPDLFFGLAPDLFVTSRSTTTTLWRLPARDPGTTRSTARR